MSNNDGGPAFPFEGGSNNGVQPQAGMTLRDYFAAKALQGILANPSLQPGSGQVASALAYKAARAMLAERGLEADPIAAAAPELLAALEAVVRVADRATNEFDMARAAIAKARGES